MFFVAEAVLFRDRWYWYDKQMAAPARHMRLSYQPLTRRGGWWFRPRRSATPAWPWGRPSTPARKRSPPCSGFRTGRSRTANIDRDERYNVDFRFRLDVSQLPRPFQIGAVGQDDWNISVMRNQRVAFESAR